MNIQTIIALALTFSFPGVLAAQRPASMAELAGHRTEAYTKALELGPNEVEAIRALLINGEKELAGLRQQCADLQAQIEQKMLDQERNFETVLSKTQMIQLEGLRGSGTFNPTKEVSCSGAIVKDCCQPPVKKKEAPKVNTLTPANAK